jgi:hypothetical protein
VKDENGDLLADSHMILNWWKNYFSQLFNVYRASDVRQIEIHTAEPSYFCVLDRVYRDVACTRVDQIRYNMQLIFRG